VTSPPPPRSTYPIFPLFSTLWTFSAFAFAFAFASHRLCFSGRSASGKIAVATVLCAHREARPPSYFGNLNLSTHHAILKSIATSSQADAPEPFWPLLRHARLVVWLCSQPRHHRDGLPPWRLKRQSAKIWDRKMIRINADRALRRSLRLSGLIWPYLCRAAQGRVVL
jgi:hypothetical protein